MTLWLRDLLDRFDQLSLRERVMVMAALLVVLLALWDNVLMRPLDREAKQRRQQVEALRAEVAGLEQSVEAIVAQGGNDPERQAREAIDKIRKELAGLDQQLAGATSGLIAPKEMAHVLEQVLQRTARLTLDGLRTLPPQALVAPAAGDGATGTRIYRHGIELELSGGYLEVLNFLQALEALQWRFFWDRIEYRVDEYPKGHVKLTLYTLGLQEGWIGV